MRNFILIFVNILVANAAIDPNYRTKDYIYLMPKLSAIEDQKISPFIIGETEAVPHSRPYQVALYINGLFFCGGILLSNSWVLTSAHCVSGASSIIVQLGAHNRKDEEPTQVTIESNHIISHELYNVIELFNDIALLELDTPVEFTDEIQPIALTSVNDPQIGAGENVTISGWGSITDANISENLNQITIETISNADCIVVYGDAAIQENKLCTDGSIGFVSCNGDTGPLTYDSTDGTQVIGILSFGAINGCATDYPAVFTRVSYYLDWIQENTGGI